MSRSYLTIVKSSVRGMPAGGRRIDGDRPIESKLAMTIDEFLLMIYEMGKGHQRLAVNSKALEASVGSEYGQLFENANAAGYLKIYARQVGLTAGGKHRVAMFQ